MKIHDLIKLTPHVRYSVTQHFQVAGLDAILDALLELLSEPPKITTKRVFLLGRNSPRLFVRTVVNTVSVVKPSAIIRGSDGINRTTTSRLYTLHELGILPNTDIGEYEIRPF